MNDIMKMLQQAAEQSTDQKDQSPLPSIQAEGHAAQLRDIFKTLEGRTKFKVGALVIRDPNIGRMYKKPRENQPALVIESLNDPIYPTGKDSGSPEFGIPCDTRIMLIDDGGDLLSYWFWHKELLPYNQQ